MSPISQILAYLEIQHQKAVLPEPEFIALVWNGLLASSDMNSTADQIQSSIIKEITSITPMLEPFCQKPATEVALINTIQIWCYENTKAMPAFAKILKVRHSFHVCSQHLLTIDNFPGLVQQRCSLGSSYYLLAF